MSHFPPPAFFCLPLLLSAHRGTVCYRRNLALSSEECSGKELYLEFEGANTVAEVYINGRFAGEHSGGYSAFRFDITDYIYLDKDNLIAVIVSNAPTDYIAPITDNGDFTKMGGLSFCWMRDIFMMRRDICGLGTGV